MQKLTLEVPAAFAIDYVCILEVKAFKTSSEESWRNFHACKEYLQKQDQTGAFAKAYDSKEYMDLFRINTKIFDLVDRIKIEDINALVVDAENYNRAKVKKIIQNKYFGGGEVEQKIGYKNNS
jgi:ABC-type metal ion transport system substrate-binding protein